MTRPSNVWDQMVSFNAKRSAYRRYTSFLQGSAAYSATLWRREGNGLSACTLSASQVSYSQWPSQHSVSKNHRVV